MTPNTVLEAETMIQEGLERLRGVPLNEEISRALSFILPDGYKLSVQLEEDGRKKRSTASIANWNHSTGEIVLFFEPVSLASSLSAPLKTPADAPVSTFRATDRAPNSDKITADQEVRECCSALAEAEKMGRQFYAIKWFRDNYLPQRGYAWTSSVQDRQRVLNHVIHEGFIDTQTIPNPKNPAFPTTTLLLNRDKAKGIVGSRFRPITLRGEPLSETIIRERGER